MNKETFVKKGSNAVAIGVGAIAVIQDLDNAEINNNLPHNALILSNMSDDCELFIFLDDAMNVNVPDFVLYPNTNMAIKHEDGIAFNTIFIKNTHGAVEVAINELKYRFSTIKEM